MELTVPLWMFITDVLLLFCIGYATVYSFRRIPRYGGSLHRLILYLTVSLFIATLGKGMEIIGDLSQYYKMELQDVIPIVYFISIIGAVYAVVNYITKIEEKIFPGAYIRYGKLKVEPGSYLFLFEEEDELITLLQDTEASILAVTRNPKGYSKFGARINKVWVSMAVETAVPPTKLHVIQDMVIKFLRNVGRGIVLIDCVEYLILYNDFETVFKFLTSLKDYVMLMNSTLVVAVKKGVLSERELKILEREFRRVEKLINRE